MTFHEASWRIDEDSFPGQWRRWNRWSRMEDSQKIPLRTTCWAFASWKYSSLHQAGFSHVVTLRSVGFVLCRQTSPFIPSLVNGHDVHVCMAGRFSKWGSSKTICIYIYCIYIYTYICIYIYIYFPSFPSEYQGKGRNQPC